jgi:hypothetical protein
VFLSYASQDVAAALRICETLRASGVVVWFDQNELVGGDAWDAKIRKQIAECALFVPVISANTQARTEGYFRLEWKLAAQRTHMIADDAAFLLPVVIDETRDADARVPGEFKAVQWTRLPGGEKSEVFCGRVKKLLGGGAVLKLAPETSGRGLEPPASGAPAVRSRPRWQIGMIAALGVLVAGGVWWTLKRPASVPAAESKRVAPSATSAAPKNAPVSEARRLVAKAWEQMDKTEMARNELLLAEGFCKQAAALEETNPAVWAAWSAMNTWYCFHGFELLPARKEAAADGASVQRQLPTQFPRASRWAAIRKAGGFFAA